jgi:hypothetical protein
VTRIIYEGEVVLECQEGGYATPTIALMDADPVGRLMDINSIVKTLGGDSVGLPLSELLDTHFGSGGGPGDKHLGVLRITVERP